MRKECSLFILGPDAGLRWGSPARAAAASTLLLDLAAKRIGDCVDLAYKGEWSIEKEPDGPVIVLSLLPDSVLSWRPAADDLILSAGVRLLLSRPSLVVLFLSPLARDLLNVILQDWLRLSPQRELSLDGKYGALASRAPFSWSFLTVDELLTGGDIEKRLLALKACARFQIYDPTGIRSFFHLAVSNLEFEEADGETMPPRAALIVDDEEEPRERYAYLLRRLGFSPLPIHEEELWKTVQAECESTSGPPFELALVDDYLGFNDSPQPLGHEWLRKSTIRHKWFKTARTASGRTGVNEPTGSEHRVDPRAVDAGELGAAYRIVNPNARLKSPFFDVCREASERARDSHFHQVLIQAGLALFERGEKLAGERRFREAALSYLEAFLLLRRRDGPGAARSLGRLEEIEIGMLLDEQPERFNERWPERREEIERGLRQAFGKDRTREVSSWMEKIYRRIARRAREQGSPGIISDEIERATREARALELHQDGNWVRGKILSAWNSFSRYHDSLWRVAGTWSIMIAIFGVFYFLKDETATVPGAWGLRLARAGLASLAGGIGLMYPGELGMTLPQLWQSGLGLLQRIFALLLFARMMTLFASRFRDNA